MEQKQCPICGKIEDTGSLLLDKRLRKQFDYKTLTGFGMCKECEEFSKEYLTLIVCKNMHDKRTTLKVEEADRTGELIRIKYGAAKNIFNIPLDLPMAFIDEEAANKIKSMVQ